MISYALSTGSFGLYVTEAVASAIRKSKFRNYETHIVLCANEDEESRSSVQRTRDLIKEGVLRTASVHLPYNGDLYWDPSVADETVRRDVSARLIRLIRENADLMAPMVTLHASYGGIPQEEHPYRLENGSFDSLCRLAEEQGIELALWMAPSGNLGYRDHQEFAELILDFYRKYNFRLFKIDGAYFSSYDAGEKFTSMLQTVREQSGKEVFFNLDVTTGMRGGFFMLLDQGNLFLENRYLFAGIGYHPERTLRNVWNLAKYCRLQSLQIEIPYPGDIKREFYQEKGECCPDVYPWDYWMAVAFCGNPLLWFAPSLVPAEQQALCRRMMELHKQYRDQLFACEIFPVGDMPTGSSLTGFAAKKDDDTAEFLVLFREKDAVCDRFETDGDWTLIAGNAEFSCGTIILPTAPGYAILKR